MKNNSEQAIKAVEKWALSPEGKALGEEMGKAIARFSMTAVTAIMMESFLAGARAIEQSQEQKAFAN